MARYTVYFLLLVAAVCTAASVPKATYCRMSKDHTMCRYQGVGKKCSTKVRGGVDNVTKMAILKALNSKRQLVAQGKEKRGAIGPQPPAANMRMLTWDDELAEVAQRWADQCEVGHDRVKQVQRFRVGQDVAWKSGKKPNYDWAGDVIDEWYDEVKNFSKAWISPYQRLNGVGHYTQMVWADTYLVGCGYTAYKKKGDTKTQHKYVCNFGPIGNIKRKAMYKAGPACTRCPSGTSCGKNGYPALCS